MADMSLDDIYRAAIQLSPDEQAQLIQRLQTSSQPAASEPLTRAKALAELERRKAAGVFRNVEDLGNKYYHPRMDNLTDEQLLSDLHEIATEWESELDRLIAT